MEKRHWWGEQEGAGGTTKRKNIKATPAHGGREMDQPGGKFPRGLIRYRRSGAHRKTCGLLRAKFKIKMWRMLSTAASKMLKDNP